MRFESVVYAQEEMPTPSPPSQPSLFSPLTFMLLIFAIFWFLLIRPNRKRDRERRDMLGSLAKGSRVVTSGGICGTIVGLSDKTVVLKVSDDPVLKMEFIRQAVSQVAKDDEDEKGA